MEIRWLDDALTDVALIYRFIAAHDPRAAAGVIARIQASIRLLATAPESRSARPWPGTRELIVPRTRYIVPYRMSGGRIEILRVLHSARRWPDEPPVE